MKVLVFEPAMSGHHAVYTAHALRACVELDISPTLVTLLPELEDEGYKHLVAPMESDFELDAQPRASSSSNLQLAQRRFELLSSAIKRHEPDHVYMLWGEGIAHYAGFRRASLRAGWPKSLAVEAIFHRSRQSYPAANVRAIATKRAFGAAIRAAKFATYHYVDLLEYEWWSKHWRGPGQVAFLPDPVERSQTFSKAEARRKLGIPVEGRYIGTTGIISKPKHVHTMLEALQSDVIPSDVRLLLAGRHKPDIAELLKSQSAPLVEAGRIVSLDRFLSMEELQLALSAMDVVLVGYQGHIGISSIVIRSTAADRPVLTGEFAWAERVVPELELGWTTSFVDPAKLAKAIGQAVSQSDSWTPGETARRFVEFHSPENFRAHLVRELQEKSNREPDPRLREWSWVEAAK